jgi:type III secretion system YscI/HrpB-like protein
VIVSAAQPAAAAAAPASAATPRPSFAEALRRGAAAAGPPPALALPRPAAEALRGIDHARAALDGALAQARAGRTFTAQELLALQADAYRFHQAVDVVSKVAEAGAQAVTQAVNTQV